MYYKKFSYVITKDCNKIFVKICPNKKTKAAATDASHLQAVLKVCILQEKFWPDMISSLQVGILILLGEVEKLCAIIILGICK